MSNNKRESNSVVLSASSLILDIEGTTSSISFVKDVLFPYVRKHLEAYINGNWDSTNVQDTVKALKTQAKEDEENKLEGVIIIPENGEKDVVVKSIIENVNWQMDNDRKTKSLKDLQGLIMEEGYTKGDLKGHVYDDVEPNLKSWTEQGKSIYIYSSGSVHAQKLLFGHSEKGDLLPFIKGHYDTSVGMKGDDGSYKKILEELSLSPSEAAFLTDIPKEARAAKSAGLFAVLVSREGNTPLADEDKADFPVITSFSDIDFESNMKKRKICTENDVNSKNKPVESCTESVKKVNKPNDPLTTNSDIEMMEVDENTDDDKGKTTENLDNKTTSEGAVKLDKLEEKEVSDKTSSEANSENVKTTSDEGVCVKQTEEPNKINSEKESSDASVVNGVAKSSDRTHPNEMETADGKLDEETDTKDIIKKDSTSDNMIKIIVSDTNNVDTEIEEKIEVESEKTVCSKNKPLQTPSDEPSNNENTSDKAKTPSIEIEKTSKGSDEIKKSDEVKKENQDGVANATKASEKTVKGYEVENSKSDNSKIESKVNDEDKPSEVSKEKLEVLTDNAVDTETKKETEAVTEEKTLPVNNESKEIIKSVSESETKQPSLDVKKNPLGEKEKAKTTKEDVKKDIVTDTEKIDSDSKGTDKTETTSQTEESKELTEDKAKTSEEEIKKDIVADEKIDTDSKADKTETTSQTVDSKELTEDKNETKVPSNDKAEVNGKVNGVEEKMANGKLTNGNSSEEKTGIANGSSSPELSNEADAEITKEKVIESKKCDVSENTAPETVVEA